MKKIICFFIFLVSIFSLSAQEIEEASKGVTYGEGVSEEATFDVYDTQLLTDTLREKDSLNHVVLRAKVTGVCAKRGCWMTLDNGKNTTVFVKMKDYGFFVPNSINGKTILLEGKANLEITSVKELKHYAKDAKKTKEEIDAITDPKEEIRFLASGIKVID